MADRKYNFIDTLKEKEANISKFKRRFVPRNSPDKYDFEDEGSAWQQTWEEYKKAVEAEHKPSLGRALIAGTPIGGIVNNWQTVTQPFDVWGKTFSSATNQKLREGTYDFSDRLNPIKSIKQDVETLKNIEQHLPKGEEGKEYAEWQSPNIPLPFVSPLTNKIANISVKDLTEAVFPTPLDLIPTGKPIAMGAKAGSKAIVKAGEEVAEATAKRIGFNSTKEMLASEAGAVGKNVNNVPMGKQPWQMTKAEYVSSHPIKERFIGQKGIDAENGVVIDHINAIREAAKTNEIPSEVLKDYPDLNLKWETSIRNQSATSPIPNTGKIIPNPETPKIEQPAQKVETPAIVQEPPKPPDVPIANTAPTPQPKQPDILGDLQDTDELITISNRPDVFRKIANLPIIKSVAKYLNPSGVADTPAKQVVVARAALRVEGDNKAIGAFSRLEALGNRNTVWGKLDDSQIIPDGKLKGKSLDEVLTYRTKYAKDMTPAQKQWADEFHNLEVAKLDLLKRNGIEINELAFEEGGEYVGRRVAGKVDPQTGELAESAFIGSPGPGKPGAKMGSEKTRYFKDIKEAMDNGFRYLPPDEALFQNLKGAYNRIADKQAADWLMDKIPWRTTGVSDVLITARDTAKANLVSVMRLKTLLNRAIRGERVPIDQTLAKSFPQETAEIKNLLPSFTGNSSAPVANRVQALTNKIDNLIAQRKQGYYKTKDQILEAHERALKTHYDEARVNAPAFNGKILTGSEAKQTAEVLNKAFTQSYGDLDGIVTAINKVNSIGRYFALAGDASVLMIQLIGFPFRYPKVWANSAKNFTKALFSTTAHSAYLAKNNDIIQGSRNLILSKGGQTEFTEAFRNGGIMQSKYAKAPKAVLEPFQRGFEAAMDTAGIELKKAYQHMADTPTKAADIEQFINEFRGVTSSARIGVTPAIRAAETAAFLAPRYNRAIAALLSDVVRGGIRGNEARKAMIALMGGMTATATAISLARGEGWEGVQRHLDPRDPSNFMTWEVAGQKVGPGSKFRSLMVLAGKITKTPEKTVDYTNDFIRGNFSPFVSTSYDILMGSDYVGNPTRPGADKYGNIIDFKEGMLGLTKRVFLKNLIPIWSQSLLMEGGTLPQKATRGGMEFFGGRGYPTSNSTGTPTDEIPNIPSTSKSSIPKFKSSVPSLTTPTKRKLPTFIKSK